MAEHFADRLIASVRLKGAPACVGIDPVYERLPDEITGATSPGTAEAAAEAVGRYCRRVVDAVASRVPAVKINIAFFERYHAAGVRTYMEVVRHARSTGLLVIGDVKRADIGHTSEMYARGNLARPEWTDLDDLCAPDAITVNPYFGIDGIKPFVDTATAEGKGIFVLVQTSNASASQLQGLELARGGTVAERAAELVTEWASGPELVGDCGYSCVGAVVSPHEARGAARLRELMPRSVFLVPGFGAQGRGPEDVLPCFKSDGTGALVTASRSVIYAYAKEGAPTGGWESAVESACGEFVESLASSVKL